MQFLLMIYQGSTPLPGSPAWNALPEAEQKRIYADYGALNQALPLGLPQDARTVRVHEGRMQVADGTYAEASRAIGGYLVLEAADLDAALQLAARIPAARLGGAVEVRPVAKYW